MSKVKKFAVDVSWVFASSVVTLLIAFIIRIFLARWLGASDLGLYQMILTIYGLATLPATFGIPAAITKYVAEFKDQDERLNQIITAGIFSAVGFGVIVGITIFALSGVFAALFHMPELDNLIRILAIIFPFTSLFQTITALFNGLRRMNYYAFLSILQYILMITFIITLVSLGLEVRGAVIGLILSVLIGCIAALYLSGKFFKLSLQGFIQTARKTIAFGSLLVSGNVVNIIANHTDIILIGYFLSKEDVGFYSAAISLSMFMTIIPSAIQRITYPATSEYYSKQDHSVLNKMIDKSMKYSTVALLPIGLGIGFFAGEIITMLFGQQFSPATLPLIVLLIARVIRGGTNVSIGGSFTGAGRPDIMLKISIVSAALNVLLNILLIPRYGITGAAIATTSSLLLGNVIFLVLMPRILEVSLDLMWFGRVYGIACLSIAVFILLSHIVNTYISGSIILFAFAIFILKYALKKEDIATFKSMIFSSRR